MTAGEGPVDRTPADAAAYAERLLDVVDHDVVPLTRAGVERGDKLFGAAILRREDLSLVVAGTNHETGNPLWHGEVSAINAFYELPEDQRPDTRDCVFLATHEPCSLCLSAVTWTGFDTLVYLFTYQDTRDAFAIPHDLRILEEVFGIRDGGYRRSNAFWEATSVAELVAASPEADRSRLQRRLAATAATYDQLSATYQSGKAGSDIPLA